MNLLFLSGRDVVKVPFFIFQARLTFPVSRALWALWATREHRPTKACALTPLRTGPQFYAQFSWCLIDLCAFISVYLWCFCFLFFVFSFWGKRTNVGFSSSNHCAHTRTPPNLEITNRITSALLSLPSPNTRTQVFWTLHSFLNSS